MVEKTARVVAQVEHESLQLVCPDVGSDSFSRAPASGPSVSLLIELRHANITEIALRRGNGPGGIADDVAVQRDLDQFLLAGPLLHAGQPDLGC